jgi:hypothetical protein
MNDAITNPMESDKLSHIREIKSKGKDVLHIILRHGLSEKEAFEVEAAAIDLLTLQRLTNIVSGHNSYERGWMTVQDVIAEFRREKVNIPEPSILITVNRLFHFGMSQQEIYEITRGNWVLGERRNKAEYAFCVYRGIIRQVYKINRWIPASAKNDNQKIRARWSFEGEIADSLAHYVGCEVSHYVKQGNQNPINYLNC